MPCMTPTATSAGVGGRIGNCDSASGSFGMAAKGAVPGCPPMPADLWDLPCRAKTRAGTLCKITALHFGGRCRWRGGLSTGAKSEAGKAQSRINGRKAEEAETGVMNTEGSSTVSGGDRCQRAGWKGRAGPDDADG